MTVVRLIRAPQKVHFAENSYTRIDKALKAHLANSHTIEKTHEEKEADDDDMAKTLSLTLTPRPSNCNQPELLKLTKTLCKLFKMLAKDFAGMLDNDYQFFKGILNNPRVMHKYGKDVIADRVNKAVHRICKKLRETTTYRPDTLAKAIQLLGQIKNHPILKSSVQHEIRKTIEKLKEKRHALQHQSTPSPGYSPHMFPPPGGRRAPKPLPKSEAAKDLDKLLERLLKPTLSPF